MCLRKQPRVGMGTGVYVCVIINQISSRQLLVCECNGCTPGKAVNGTNQVCVCVCLCKRKIKGGDKCVYRCVSLSLSRRQLLV